MCVNYARKLISTAVQHSHELHNMNLACQHQQACQCLPYWNLKGIKSKSYQEQPSNQSGCVQNKYGKQTYLCGGIYFSAVLD